MPPRSSKRSAAQAAAAQADVEKKSKIAAGWQDVGEAVVYKGKALAPLLVYHTPNCREDAKKIYAFDMDWTVLKPKSGRKFPTGATDWEFILPEVPKKLKQLHTDGHRIVLFTNQGGMEKGNTTPLEIKTKITTGNNHFRKPSVFLWRHFAEQCCAAPPSPEQCVFVGDAAGRAKNWRAGAPKDFNASDRMFAENIGIPFQTPEEFFLGQAPVSSFDYGAFDPKPLRAQLAAPPPTIDPSKTQEMIVMVGCPASGKSTLSKHKFEKEHGYTRINRDEMGTASKCSKAAAAALAAGQSVVIDNTNGSPAARSEWIKLAQKHKVPCRCILMETPRDLAEHMNLFRQNTTQGRQRRVPAVGYNVFFKNYQEPTSAEGFASVLTYPFVPQFASDEERDMFFHWTC
ncbi:uncharacterized protein MONBRDRAFT_34318 [Monosiga brevicollis MX1]|uniref:Polynucleotide kinase 3'-phosphatase n=1 Tax=Monosiga brevicollis TaxID=81824 RepID=A9VAX2_MONBE|nr:uncharacterized protein MONBRDRAFT_34318 [Monosiga brevicollis MX1]EDQ85290.1 predicted protein [Monosiga brevicollis MX1]|eukprot:XP_001749911.1 hypothetical protein [Monosiga brevicollis MX1]